MAAADRAGLCGACPLLWGRGGPVQGKYTVLGLWKQELEGGSSEL